MKGEAQRFGFGCRESSIAFHKWHDYDYKENGIWLFEQISPLASLGRNDGEEGSVEMTVRRGRSK